MPKYSQLLVNQYYYCRSQLVYVSLKKTSNLKDSKIEEFEPKTYKTKFLNSNNSLCLNQGRNNTETSDKASKKKNKY